MKKSSNFHCSVSNVGRRIGSLCQHSSIMSYRAGVQLGGIGIRYPCSTWLNTSAFVIPGISEINYISASSPTHFISNTWIWNSSESHQLSQENTETPHVRFDREFAIIGRFRSCPFDRESGSDSSLVLVFLN